MMRFKNGNWQVHIGANCWMILHNEDDVAYFKARCDIVN